MYLKIQYMYYLYIGPIFILPALVLYYECAVYSQRAVTIQFIHQIIMYFVEDVINVHDVK